MIKNMIQRTIVRLAAAGILFFSLGAQADNIVYQVERAFGGATVIGTIETDGMIGSLSTANIQSWSFEIDDGSGEHGPVTFGSDSGGDLTGSGWQFLIGTETELHFDFDSAFAVGTFQDVQFFKEGSDFSYNYGWAANPGSMWKKEQFVHFFPGGFHLAEALRDGVEVVGRVHSPTDCSAPSVSLGEVLAGFQAGLTAGSHTEVGPAGEYFVAFGGEDRRGFIVPENIDVSQQCENDFILISGFFGVPFERRDGTILKPKEAIDLATSGGNGFIAGQRFEVDSVLIEHMNTTAKLGYFADGRRAAFINSGIVLEPGSLEVGSHSAKITYDLDFNRDGEVDFEFPVNAIFTINPAPADQ